MKLDKNISLNDFLGNYWLKEELVVFCRNHNIMTSGSKLQLTQRIRRFLMNLPLDEVTTPIKKLKANKDELTLENLISKNYSNDELHRAFFIRVIGKNFKFNVQFMNWIKKNKGKSTYSDAVNIWLKIDKERKSGKKNVIGKQFEYNRYMRAFFNANPTFSRADCIKCWNYKKKIPGNHVYDKSDLEILNLTSNT